MKKIFDQIDQQLLINHPHLWATKLHSFLFAYVGMIALGLLIGFSYPISTANVPDINVHFAYPFILSGIVFIIWAYKTAAFKVTEQFGDTSLFAAFKTQLVYLLIISMLMLVPFFYVSVLSFRVKNLATAAELTADCNKLNLGVEHLSLGNAQSFYLVGIDYWDNDQVLAHLAHNQAEKIVQIKDFIQTANKYGGEISITAEEIEANAAKSNNVDLSYHYRVNENIYQLSRIKSSTTIYYEKGIIWVIISVIFGVLFTLFTYMATSLRTFILSIIVGIVGAMALGLFSAVAFRGGSEKEFLLMYIFVVAGLVMVGVAEGNARFSIAFRQIALSIATVLTPFVPFAMLALADTFQGQRDNKEDFAKIVLLFSIGITWVLWQFLYLPTLKKIQSTPVNA